MNTRKIANAIAEKLNASVIDVKDGNAAVKPDSYDLAGFGAGIDSGKHYPEMLKFAENLEDVKNKKAFIFSTSAIYSEKKMRNDHGALRDILQKKGYTIVSEFSCKGHDTNSFLKFIGGLNRGRPNSEDLLNAKTFAEKLLK